MEHHTLNATELAEVIRDAARCMFRDQTYIPIFAWGDPGLGKTVAVSAAAEALGARLIVQHVADREPTEMAGIYWERNGEMVRLSPSDFPTDDEPTILFFDEVPQAPMMNKNILARIVLERSVGEHRLGRNVYVCAAGNYAHNRAGTSAMPAHLNARMTHVHVGPDVGQWLTWAAGAGVHPSVTAYNRQFPSDHHAPNPDKLASPNPRSWKRVSDIENSGIAGRAREAMIAGAIGAEAGERYIQQAALFAGMIDLDEVISNPLRAPLIQDRRLLYVAAAFLSAKTTTSNFEKIMAYMMRIPGAEEYVVVYLSEAKARAPAITSTRAFRDFALSDLGRKIL